jgi:SulP family sulfate permease
MPNAVLAAVVFLIGVRLVDIKGMSDIYRVRPGEFVVAALTAATVVVVGVEQGIILAIVLSIVLHMEHSYRPADRLVGLTPDGLRTFRPLDSNTQVEPGLAFYRFGASLYYANATRFTSEILDVNVNADPKLRWLCLASSAIGDVDYSGADAIRAVVEELSAEGTTLVLCDVDPEVRRLLDAYGLTEKIGAQNIYGTPEDVVAAFTATAQPAPAAPPATAPTPTT